VAYSWERLDAGEKAAILDGISSGAGPPPPRVVEISWQNRCNIDCFFCSTSDLRAGNSELSAARLESLFDEMRALGVKGVRLMGGGEPLFRADAVELIESLGRRGLRVNDVTTNGVLLTERVVRALFAVGCEEIRVSLNAAEPSSYAAMMRTTPKNFDRVVENVRRAADIKRETGADCVIRLQFLVYRDNYRQLPLIYRLFRDTGADRFWLNGLYPVRPMPMMTEGDVTEMLRLYEGLLTEDPFDRFEGFSFWERSIAERIAEAGRRAFAAAPLRRRTLVRLRHLVRSGPRRGRAARGLYEFCLVGWYSMTVNANGDVVTCCILQDRRTAVLGNVEKSSLREIWNGPAYRRFRQELAEIMARRGEVSDFGHACAVEGVCAEKGACPTRSHYWAGDLNFRRRFHEMVEEMGLPRGEPFEGLSDGRPGMRLPVYK